MSSIPVVDMPAMKRMRIGYGTTWMKYGAHNFTRKEGIMSARRTTPLGTVGPTRSRAAERIMT